MLHPFSVFPLGDSAFTVDFGGNIDEETTGKIYRLWHRFRAARIKGVLDIVPSYTSLTIHFDPLNPVDPFHVLNQDFQDLEDRQDGDAFNPENALPPGNPDPAIEIPVCYSPRYASDLLHLSTVTGLSIDEVIDIHTSKSYYVYMLGFLPGFAYMGEVDPRIAIGRKHKPEAVMAGSVGIAGKQTGIYPCDSPGGWQIIGRTPLSLFNPHKEPLTIFQAGDSVKFISITEDEFENY